jgi:hypothetical protein
MDELLGMSTDEVTAAMRCFPSGADAGPGSGFGVSTSGVGSANTAVPLSGSGYQDDHHMVVDAPVGEDVVAAVAGVKASFTGPLVLEITDFSPSQDHQVGGGTKVLICLGNEIPKHLQSNTIKVSGMLA